jgi:hypothetical protein
MQTQTQVAFHGKRTPRLSSWQQEQTAKQEYSKLSYRSPNFLWSKTDPKHRATVSVYMTLVDNRITKTNAVISRSFYRGGERRYSNVSLASLRRLSSIAPLPLLTDEQFTAINEALVADEMLAAGKAQAFRLIDRVDAAIAYGQVAEMVNDTEQVAA